MHPNLPRPGGGTIAAGNRNRSEIDEKLRLRRGCVFGTFLGRLGRQTDDRMVYPPLRFGSRFPSKIEKWHPKKHPKIDAEKVSEIDAKRLQNEAKMESKINDFSYFFEKANMHETIVFIS